ncbi:unnamed protein product [Meganyctiphanes norvegica]|uniref:Solute carrier family 43 member 3 n=1 Tax=Meganyctiphanes norvegica TaxID=48144 RepID=A0AAV2QDG6_MEGNR
MFCTQTDSLREMTSCHRWFMFLVAIVESMIWSGTIYGWPQLVYMLKLNGIYSQICFENLLKNTTIIQEDTKITTETPQEQFVSCPEQDTQYALIYTVACVLYSSPGMLVGYALYYLGLTVTRVAAGSMITTGFLLLAVTSIEMPETLWGAAILIAVGGNTVRMSGLQFGNLFPERKATVTAIISGIYSPSAAIFIFFKYANDLGLTWITSCLMFAAASGLILLVTPFLPRHHVPYEDPGFIYYCATHEEEMQKGKIDCPDTPNNNTLRIPVEKQILVTPSLQGSTLCFRKHSNISSVNSKCSFNSQRRLSIIRSSNMGYDRKHIFSGINDDPNLLTPFKPEYIATPTREFLSPIRKEDTYFSMGELNNFEEVPPFTDSLLSFSSVLSCYWLFINTISPIIFAAFYNPWIEKIATNVDEVGMYVWFYGYANIACMLFTLVPGLMIHASTICFVGKKTGLNARIAELQSLMVPLTIVCIITTVQFGCLLFETPIAIYISLAALAVCRPLGYGVGYPFLRLRFPGEHFDRIAGTHGTLKAILTLLQYPFFIVAQIYYYQCVWFAVGMLLLGLAHPAHLLSRHYLARVLYTPQPNPFFRNLKQHEVTQSYETK